MPNDFDDRSPPDRRRRGFFGEWGGPDPRHPAATQQQQQPVPVNDYERNRRASDRELYDFPPHLRDWFDGLDRDDIACFSKLLRLNPKTIDWISSKNERELKTLDDAVEFVSSSRTAAKVLMYVTGAAVTVIGAAFAWAKGVYDWFAILKVPPR